MAINDLGGGENREKKFEGPSPGKKSQKPSFRKNFKRPPWRKENFKDVTARKNKFVSDIFYAPQIINGLPLRYIYVGMEGSPE